MIPVWVDATLARGADLIGALALSRPLHYAVRAILAAAVKPADRLRMGDELSALGRELGLSNEDVDALRASRNTRPAEPLGFE